MALGAGGSEGPAGLRGPGTGGQGLGRACPGRGWWLDRSLWAGQGEALHGLQLSGDPGLGQGELGGLKPESMLGEPAQ